MKRFLISATLVLIAVAKVFCQGTATAYDENLADSLGGDANGMRQYSFVMLKTGPANITDKAIRDSLFKTHFANMEKLSKQNKLIVAGPFMKNDKGYRGIFIIKAPVEEVQALIDGDGAIKSGILAAEIIPWYGSAALPMYLPYHERIEKKARQ